jgi:conjugal transfer pilus assembly protein TraA
MANPKFLKIALVGAFALTATAMAGATAIDQSDAFYTFWKTVDGWTSGGLGVGLATTMLLMGGFIGAAQNSPMPALSGVAGAAFLHWGPGVIQTIMLNGALV